MISREFITAGRAVFTTSNPQGDRFTFRVRKCKWKSRFMADQSFLIGEWMNGPDNEVNYVPMLAIDPAFLIPLVAPNAPLWISGAKPSNILRWVLKLIRNGEQPPPGYEIRHAGRCGRCGRLLTVPESIETGLGPECSKVKGK